MSAAAFDSAEGVILAFLVSSFGLLYALRRLSRKRLELAIFTPVAIGVVVRILAFVAVNASGKGSTLRGGDETTFLQLAQHLAGTPLGHGFFPHGPYQLQTVLFALQMKLLHFSPSALRMTQVGISMLGLVFIVAAVYDIAGPRSARLLAWLFAFEPSNVFFNSEIHKEPLMLLATGLVVFGGTKLWRRFDVRGAVLPCVLGGAIGVETRSYAGWFLVISVVLLLLHAALRRLDTPLHSLPIIYLVIGATVLAAPTLLHVTSAQSLKTLQNSQDYTTGVQASTNAGGANGDNLANEQVNLGTRSAVIAHLPGRVFDLIFRPYPWQVSDVSQQLGAIGTMLALVGLWMLLRYAWLARRGLLGLVTPMLYPFLFLMVVYALSAGNAGTGFRYRSHLVALGAAMLVTLRARVRAAEVGEIEINAKSETLAGQALVTA